MTYTSKAARRDEIQAAFSELEWAIAINVKGWPRWLCEVLVECCRLKCAHELEWRELV